MFDDLGRSLQNLKQISAQGIEDEYWSADGTAPVIFEFGNGTRLRADYWRLTKDSKALISSFDHKHQYGLPAPINALDVLRRELEGAAVTDARHEKETGDLLFSFANDTKLEVFNFTGYEIWEITFPDGTVEYSNYAK